MSILPPPLGPCFVGGFVQVVLGRQLLSPARVCQPCTGNRPGCSLLGGFWIYLVWLSLACAQSLLGKATLVLHSSCCLCWQSKHLHQISACSSHAQLLPMLSQHHAAILQVVGCRFLHQFASILCPICPVRKHMCTVSYSLLTWSLIAG